MPRHKLYGAAKAEKAERKRIEEEDRKMIREVGEDVSENDEFTKIQKKLAGGVRERIRRGYGANELEGETQLIVKKLRTKARAKMKVVKEGTIKITN